MKRKLLALALSGLLVLPFLFPKAFQFFCAILLHLLGIIDLNIIV